MAESSTQRLDLILNDDDELVDIDEINSNFQSIDDWLIPACKLERTTGAGTQSIPNNTTTELDFNQAEYDTWNGKPEGAMADAANNRIISRINGLYIVEAMVCFTSNPTGIRAIMLNVDGAVWKRVQIDANAAASTPVTVMSKIPLNSGQNVSASVVQGSGGALTVDPALPAGTETFVLSATWLGKKP